MKVLPDFIISYYVWLWYNLAVCVGANLLKTIENVLRI